MQTVVLAALIIIVSAIYIGTDWVARQCERFADWCDRTAERLETRGR